MLLIDKTREEENQQSWSNLCSSSTYRALILSYLPNNLANAHQNRESKATRLHDSAKQDQRFRGCDDSWMLIKYGRLSLTNKQPEKHPNTIVPQGKQNFEAVRQGKQNFACINLVYAYGLGTESATKFCEKLPVRIQFRIHHK
eukprot:scaffold4805_cov136-Cylindrotheca_fusiformis.AAC.27